MIPSSRPTAIQLSALFLQLFLPYLDTYLTRVVADCDRSTVTDGAPSGTLGLVNQYMDQFAVNASAHVLTALRTPSETT